MAHICTSCMSKMSCGIWWWKYILSLILPTLVRQASVAIMASGIRNCSNHMMETPLYLGKNFPHHPRSFFVCSSTVYSLPHDILGILLKRHATKARDGLMQLITACNFPAMLSNWFLIIYILWIHFSSSWDRSCNFSCYKDDLLHKIKTCAQKFHSCTGWNCLICSFIISQIS